MNRKTVTALGVFVVLAAIALFALRQPEKGERAADHPHPIAKLNPAEITSLEVTRNGATTTIKSEGARYRIVAPVAYAADDASAKAAFEGLGKMDISDLVTEQKASGFVDAEISRDTTVDGDHGRIEKRKLWVCWDVQELLGKELTDAWPDLRALIAIERTRELNGKTTVTRHHYISSLDKRTKAKRLAACIRGHWSIENNLHWQLDVSFSEDDRRIRKGHGAENFSRLNRIGLTLLQEETTQKTGIAIKRQTCGWNNEYLIKVITGGHL